MKIKEIIIAVIVIISFNDAIAQFCNTTATNLGVLVPSSSTQTTSIFSTGRRYFTFSATAGCTYDFSTCGLSTIDTYLSLYSGTVPSTAIFQTSNDDACGLQSDINWTCTSTGLYSILITRWTSTSNCNAVNANVQLSYNVSCPYSTTLNIPSSGSNTISCGSNTTVYDNGGVSDYSNSNNGFTVINSSPTNSVNIKGSYNTESGFDYIYIYAGIGTGGTLLATFNGVGSINYTGNLGQTLTINFSTDVSVTYSGFQLNVTYMGLCSFLPIELVYFNSESVSCGENLIKWKTASEINNNYFEIERSLNAVEFYPINKIYTQSNSLSDKYYSFKDLFNFNDIVYYRLKQVDLDGTINYSNITSTPSICTKKQIVKITNLLGQEVPENFEGYKLIIYSDGSVYRKIN